MKPVSQTKFGGKHGNCLAAAISSILELDKIDNITDTTSNEWLYEISNALREKHGYSLIKIRNDLDIFTAGLCVTNSYVIAVGKSPRNADADHAVVCEWNVTNHGPGEIDVDIEFVHDPDPSGKYIDGDIKYFLFVVKS